MQLFINIHRSITDPSFYLWVISQPKRKALGFLMQLLTISVLVISLLHTSRLRDKDSGLPAILPRMFPEMEISSYTMRSFRKTPYIVNTTYISNLMSVLYSKPVSYFDIPDTFIVVDTAYNVNESDISPYIVLNQDDIVFKLYNGELLHLPYSLFVKENHILRLTQEDVYQFIKKSIGVLFFFNFFAHFLELGSIIGVSILFLFIAAYIFKGRYIKNHGAVFKIVIYALSPLLVGNVLMAVANVFLSGTWHVLMILSSFLCFRGLEFITRKPHSTFSSGESI